MKKKKNSQEIQWRDYNWVKRKYSWRMKWCSTVVFAYMTLLVCVPEVSSSCSMIWFSSHGKVVRGFLPQVRHQQGISSTCTHHWTVKKYCQYVKGGDLSLFSRAGEATSGILCPVLGSSVQDTNILERVQQRSKKVIKGLEHVSSQQQCLWHPSTLLGGVQSWCSVFIKHC